MGLAGGKKKRGEGSPPGPLRQTPSRPIVIDSVLNPQSVSYGNAARLAVTGP
jgi:hypothetical protein